MRINKDLSFEVPNVPHSVSVGVANKTACCRSCIDFAVGFLVFFKYVDMNDTTKRFQGM